MSEKPWENEPDRKEFRHKGFPCVIIRNEMSGSLCGYVGIPRTHCLASQYGDDLHEEGYDLEVHGGITYSGDTLPGKRFSLNWWFGFDCNHGYDLAPKMEEIHRAVEKKIQADTGDPSYKRPETIYRDIKYVEAQCRQLANQLYDAEWKEKGNG